MSGRCRSAYWALGCQRPEGHRGRHRSRSDDAESTWANPGALPVALDDLARRAAQHADPEVSAVAGLMLSLAETLDDLLGPEPQHKIEPQPVVEVDDDPTEVRTIPQKVVPASIWARPEEQTAPINYPKDPS